MPLVDAGYFWIVILLFAALFWLLSKFVGEAAVHPRFGFPIRVFLVLVTALVAVWGVLRLVAQWPLVQEAAPAILGAGT